MYVCMYVMIHMPLWIFLMLFLCVLEICFLAKFLLLKAHVRATNVWVFSPHINYFAHFYPFILMGTMFPSNNCNFYVSASMFFHQVHFNWHFNVYYPLPPGYFGIWGNFVNYSKFNAFFLLLYYSMKAISLFKGYFIIVKYH